MCTFYLLWLFLCEELELFSGCDEGFPLQVCGRHFPEWKISALKVVHMSCVCLVGGGALIQHFCLLWPISVTGLPLAVISPTCRWGQGAAGWPRAPQSLVWPWPAGRGTISSAQAAMRPCLEQCLFLLNLEQLSEAALPHEHTLFFCCCCVRTRGEYRLTLEPESLDFSCN